jgi:Protein of unknown function (DUF2877)
MPMFRRPAIIAHPKHAHSSSNFSGLAEIHVQGRNAGESEAHQDISSDIPVIRAIGCKAHAALVRSGGLTEPIAGFGEAPYVTAAGEIVWIGPGPALMHPRVVMLDASAPFSGDKRFPVGTLVPWHPPVLPFGTASRATLREGCARLTADLRRIGTPRGFAALLLGEALAFPFSDVAMRVQSLREGLSACDLEGPYAPIEPLYAAAVRLLGVGAGLTPSGDDLVGAVLFMRVVTAATIAELQRWQELAARLDSVAAIRSHVIGAALFRDLATGASFEPLHRTAYRLAAGDHPGALDAARELVAIGSSSGWDMLTGLIIAATGNAH